MSFFRNCLPITAVVTALGPPIGAIPMALLLFVDVYANNSNSGAAAVFLPLFSLPVFLIGGAVFSYYLAAGPAAVVGFVYAVVLLKWPSLDSRRPVRMAIAAGIAATVCLPWFQFDSQLRGPFIHGVDKDALVRGGCGIFAALAVSYFVGEKGAGSAC
jgi:hypothetical protein